MSQLDTIDLTRWIWEWFGRQRFLQLNSAIWTMRWYLGPWDPLGHLSWPPCWVVCFHLYFAAAKFRHFDIRIEYPLNGSKWTFYWEHHFVDRGFQLPPFITWRACDNIGSKGTDSWWDRRILIRHHPRTVTGTWCIKEWFKCQVRVMGVLFSLFEN